MNGAYYRDILERNLCQSAHSLGLKPGWVFQQDNNTKHIAKLTKSWLSSNRIDCLKWLRSQSDWKFMERAETENSKKEPAGTKRILSWRMEKY